MEVTFSAICMTGVHTASQRKQTDKSLFLEAKLIAENLLPLGLEDDEFHSDKRPEYA